MLIVNSTVKIDSIVVTGTSSSMVVAVIQVSSDLLIDSASLGDRASSLSMALGGNSLISFLTCDWNSFRTFSPPSLFCNIFYFSNFF